MSLLLASCGGRESGAQQQPSTETTPTTLKRVTAAVRGDPPTLSHFANRATSTFTVAGGLEIQKLVNGSLSVPDDHGVFRPQLAEQLPSVENGLWKLWPDGRMETTWRIKEGSAWHDGTPFTAQDLVFTAAVVGDKSLAVFRNVAYDAIERVEAHDARTVVVTWNKPFIDADTLFSPELAPLLPRHLLERAYTEDRDGLLQLPYWSQEFVGTGPFRLREFVRGSHLVLEANDRYVPGHPRLDQIEVRFIPDTNSLTANLLVHLGARA